MMMKQYEYCLSLNCMQGEGKVQQIQIILLAIGLSFDGGSFLLQNRRENHQLVVSTPRWLGRCYLLAHLGFVILGAVVPFCTNGSHLIATYHREARHIL